MVSVPPLEGRHVRLLPLAPDHVEALTAAGGGDRSTFDYTWVPPDTEAMAAYVEKALDKQRAGEQCPFATYDVAADRVVGSTRFYDIETWEWTGTATPDQPHRDGPDVVSIGHTWLAPGAQRSPVNTEAKLLMLGWAFDHWGVRAVRLRTDVRNQRSRRAIERLGCRLDGVLRCDRPATDGSVRDTATYSMVAGEWPEARHRLEARLAG